MTTQNQWIIEVSCESIPDTVGYFGGFDEKNNPVIKFDKSLAARVTKTVAEEFARLWNEHKNEFTLRAVEA